MHVLSAESRAQTSADADVTRECPPSRLPECLASLQAGDVLVVDGLDDLGRSQRAVLATLEDVRGRRAGLRAPRGAVDTTAPGGDALFRLSASLAGIGRDAIAAGTSAGMAAARARGTRLGPPPALTPQHLRGVRRRS